MEIILQKHFVQLYWRVVKSNKFININLPTLIFLDIDKVYSFHKCHEKYLFIFLLSFPRKRSLKLQFETVGYIISQFYTL